MVCVDRMRYQTDYKIQFIFIFRQSPSQCCCDTAIIRSSYLLVSYIYVYLARSPPSCGGGLFLSLSPGELSKLESCTPCGITPFLWWRPLFASFTWRAIQAGVLHSLWDHPLLVVEAFVCLFHLESYPSWSLALLWDHPCWTGQTRSGPWPSRPAAPITNILNVSTQVNCTDFPHRLYLLSHYQLDLYC